MKKLLFLLSLGAVVATLVACGRDKPTPPKLEPMPARYDIYYVYRGEKILLTPIDTRTYILFANSDRDAVVEQMTAMGAEFNDWTFSVDGFENPDNHLFDCSQAIVGASYDDVKVINELIYAEPFYVDEQDNEIGILSEIGVVLNNDNDLLELRELAEKNDLLFLGRDNVLKDWYFFVCTKDSNGNSLGMANRLYDSGLVEHSTPNMLTDTYPVN